MSRARSLILAAALFALAPLAACSSVTEPSYESSVGRLTQDQTTNDRAQQGQRKEHRGERPAEEQF